jgi:hypothetical protein
MAMNKTYAYMFNLQAEKYQNGVQQWNKYL